MGERRKPVYEPTPEEIEAAKAEIRASWREKTKCGRQADDRARPKSWTAPLYRIVSRPGAADPLIMERLD